MPAIQAKALILAQLRARRKANEQRRDMAHNVFSDVVAWCLYLVTLMSVSGPLRARNTMKKQPVVHTLHG